MCDPIEREDAWMWPDLAVGECALYRLTIKRIPGRTSERDLRMTLFYDLYWREALEFPLDLICKIFDDHPALESLWNPWTGEESEVTVWGIAEVHLEEDPELLLYEGEEEYWASYPAEVLYPGRRCEQALQRQIRPASGPSQVILTNGARP